MKYWKDLDKEDRNYLYNAGIVGVIALVSLYLSFYLFDSSQNGRNTTFFLKSFGTIITITGLGYAIHIQLKLKKITDLLNQNTKQIQENISSNYQAWNIARAISLSSEVEQALIDKNYKAALVLIRILKENLTDCKKSFFNEFDKQLEKCIKCEDENKGKSLAELVAKCKEECNFSVLQKLKRYNKNLTKQLVNISAGLSEKKDEINVLDGLKIVEDVRQILNEIKPSPVQSI